MRARERAARERQSRGDETLNKGHGGGEERRTVCFGRRSIACGRAGGAVEII